MSEKEFSRDFALWFSVVLLQEGIDAIRAERELAEEELTDIEEGLDAVLEQLSQRYWAKIYPESISELLPMTLADVPEDELWARAGKLAKGAQYPNGLDPLDLLRRRDNEHPRGGCRFCEASETIMG